MVSSAWAQLAKRAEHGCQVHLAARNWAYDKIKFWGVICGGLNP